MTRDKRYDILFEPLRIGPVETKNRFYQVPHCNGMGFLRPRMLAEMRGVKAEGGWGVVCTEYCSIHPSSDDLPHPYASLWNEADIKSHALTTEKIHAHGALAGVELWAGGAGSPNLLTREVPRGVSSKPILAGHPYQTRPMDKKDIRDLRRWHRNAALRAKEAGFDIVYVYATHGYLLSQFLSPVLDFGDAIIGRSQLLELATPIIFLCQGDASLVNALLESYGFYAVPDRESFQRNLMATVLIRPDCDLSFVLSQVPETGVRETWDQVSSQLFPL